MCAAALSLTAAAPPGTFDPDIAEWFQAQLVPGTQSTCCNLADGRVTRLDYRDGAPVGWIDDRFPDHKGQPPEWVVLPESARLHTTNIMGQLVVWWYQGKVRCWVPPPQT